MMPMRSGTKICCRPVAINNKSGLLRNDSCGSDAHGKGALVMWGSTRVGIAIKTWCEILNN